MEEDTMTEKERERLDMEVASGLGRMYRSMLDNAVNPPEYAEINDIVDKNFWDLLWKEESR